MITSGQWTLRHCPPSASDTSCNANHKRRAHDHRVGWHRTEYVAMLQIQVRIGRRKACPKFKVVPLLGVLRHFLSRRSHHHHHQQTKPDDTCLPRWHNLQRLAKSPSQFMADTGHMMAAPRPAPRPAPCLFCMRPSDQSDVTPAREARDTARAASPASS